MVVGRTCKHRKDDGRPCRAAPRRDNDFCLWHSPDHTTEAAEARRLGGLRRRREKTLSITYDFDGLSSVEGIRRLLEIAVMDTLALENAVQRSRTLAYLAQVGLKTLEIAQFEERVQALEDAVARRRNGRGTRR